ncbi:MAG: arsenate reductase [Bryobacterales bacterium]|nr:arsenate reductase [Bryobacterales bacterium]
MLGVQIFGVKNSQAARAAERFFKERRIPLQIVDLKQRPLAPAEIRRFVDKFGWDAILDREGRSFSDAGLKYLKLSETDFLARIEKDPLLLHLPLVRAGKLLAAGKDETAWKAMAEELSRK